MYRHTKLSLLLCLLLVLTACARIPAPMAPSETPQARGRLILWHGWSGPQADVLDTLIDRFVEIYPDTRIVRSAVPADQLVERFRMRAEMGLGPDLLIVPARALSELARDGLVQDLSPHVGSGSTVDIAPYFAPAIESVRYGDGIYGLPFALSTMVLYHNRELAPTPPTTLDGLLREATDGRAVALNTDFYRAFWGIKAFGGQLFDDQGRVVLDQGGFANWLGWLKIAQQNAGVFVGTDREAAAALLTSGRVAYYVGSSTEVHVLREALGDGLLGVAKLPAGPYRPAGPFLETEALAFNASSSSAQTELALRLARFLTGTEQQTKLARQAAHIPANANVRVDRRLYPETAEFMAQAQMGVPFLNLPQMSTVLAQGDAAYVLALEGVVSVAEAAQQLANQVNSAHGLSDDGQVAAVPCELEGALWIWHATDGGDAGAEYSAVGALRRLAQEFMRVCPGVYLILSQVELEALHPLYQQAMVEGGAPDMLIAPSAAIAPLADKGLIQALDDAFGPQSARAELTQRYLPVAAQATSHRGRLYGLPLALHMTALYYDPGQVANPARTLTELLQEAIERRYVALPMGAYRGLWGAAAFDGLAPEEEQRPRLAAEGLAEWLDWLREAHQTPGVTLGAEADVLADLLVQGEVAYLVGDTSLLPRLWSALGTERVRVAPLPSGPAGDSCPFLSVEALLLKPGISPATAELAMAFAAYATGIEGQTVLMESAARVPANVNVHTEGYPAIAGFLEQAKTTAIPQSCPYDMELWAEGDRIIAAWLAGNGDVGDLQRFIHAMSGLDMPRLEEAETEQGEATPASEEVEAEQEETETEQSEATPASEEVEAEQEETEQE